MTKSDQKRKSVMVFDIFFTISSKIWDQKKKKKKKLGLFFKLILTDV